MNADQRWTLPYMLTVFRIPSCSFCYSTRGLRSGVPWTTCRFESLLAYCILVPAVLYNYIYPKNFFDLL